MPGGSCDCHEAGSSGPGSAHIRCMSKHVGYVAATHEELSVLIHSPSSSTLTVHPNIVSASADIGSLACLYEVIITLDAGESFYAERRYSGSQYETFFDAYSDAAGSGRVVVRRGDEETEVTEHVSVGPRVLMA